MKTRHKQIRLYVGLKKPISVDTALAGIIFDLWKLGIHTSQSCEDNQGKYVWICADIKSVIRLFDLSKACNKKLYTFLTQKCLVDTVFVGDAKDPSNWDVSIRFDKKRRVDFEKMCDRLRINAWLSTNG